MSKQRAIPGHLFGAGGAFPARAAAILLAGALTMVAVRADEHVKLNIQTGLWEVTVHPQISGADPMRMEGMDKEMARLSPEQREKMQAAMQAMMANAVREHVFRECMTEERLSKGFQTSRESPSCTSKLVTNTSTDFEYHSECASDGGAGNSQKAHFHIHNRHSVSGTIDVSESRGGQSTLIHETLEGKWLASDCGGIKEMQMVK